MVSEVAGPNAWWRLFNEPNLKKFEEPTVHSVDYPRMGLSQAYYDRRLRTLLLRTYPIDQSGIGSSTSFRVTNLERPGDCTVLADGAPYNPRTALVEVQTRVLEISLCSHFWRWT